MTDALQTAIALLELGMCDEEAAVNLAVLQQLKYEAALDVVQTAENIIAKEVKEWLEKESQSGAPS
jgi:hypothetical protein